MKLIHHLLVVVLAIAVLAAPKNLKRSGLDLPPGAYWESDDVIVLPNNPPTPEERADMDRINDLAARDESLDFANSALSLEETASSNTTITKRGDINFAEIFIDPSAGSTVGTLQGQRLYNKLNDCFRAVCKILDGNIHCYDGSSGDQIPSCKIPNIVVDLTGKGDYDTKGTFQITYGFVKRSPEKGDVDSAIYGMISAMFKLMAEVDSNCRWVDFKDSRKTRLCSVARHALVAFPMRSGSEEHATIFSAVVQGPTHGIDNTKFSCGPKIRKSVYEYFHNIVKHKFAKIMGITGYIDAHVTCMAPAVSVYCFKHGWKEDCSGKRDPA